MKGRNDAAAMEIARQALVCFRADFFAKDRAGLRKEGSLSLKVLLEMCREDGVKSERSVVLAD